MPQPTLDASGRHRRGDLGRRHVTLGPDISAEHVLLKDPGTTDTTSFGSLFVFRKLEQAVKNFKTRNSRWRTYLASRDDRELAGAMIVGRFEDGTPVTLSKAARGGKPPNNFNYSGDAGIRCPFHGHSQANPRGTGGAEPEALERKHIMARRGIPFEDVKRYSSL